MRYPVEAFTDAESELLAPHFTNLDRPVFCLINLPETIKGAMFARYSRYPGTLRRLYLDEFAADVPDGGRPFEGAEGERAAGLYERVFGGFGDDSIAQLGGAHIACEWVSNILTKDAAARPPRRLPRAVDALHPLRQPDGLRGGGGPGRWRYYRDAELGDEFIGGDGRAVRDLLAQPRRPSRSGPRSAGRAETTSPRPPGGARSRPRRSTCCAGCCPPRP